MSMTKEQQKAAAERILAKFPLTEEEKRMAEFLKRTPEQYEPPRNEARKCAVCGAEFEQRGELTAMQQFSDHQAMHSHSPSQWTEAYNQIRKKRESQSSTDRT